MTKPYYIIHFKIYGSRFKLKINDLLVFQNDEGLGISLQLPINSFIRDGQNDIELNIFPNDENLTLTENTKGSITIFYNDDNKANTKQEVISHIIPAFDGIKASTSYSYKDTFSATVYFEDSIIFKSDLIKNYADVNFLLIEQYKLIHHYLRKKDLAPLLELMKYRQKEISHSMYLTLKAVNDSAMEAFTENIYNSNWVLSDINESEYKLIVEGYGKAVKFVTKDNYSPVYFVDEKSDQISSYDFLFCINSETKKMTLVR